MNIVNDILVNTLFPDTDFIQTLDMNSVVPKYVENQEKGNPSVCKNCAEAPFRDLHIYGRSEQMTTTGAQLIDINSFQKNNDISVKIANNYSIELTSTIKKDASDSSRVYLNVIIDADVLVGKTITMSYDGWNSNVPNEVFVCGIVYNIDGKNNYESILSGSRTKTVTIPLGAKDCKVRLFLIEKASATIKVGTYTAIIKGLMICEGTVAKSWEPYTGGKPSPSPDYPQEIQSVGDGGSVAVKVTGKNLLDFLHAEITKAGWQGKFTRDEEILTISAVNGWSVYWFVSPVRGKQISVSFTYRQIDDKTFDSEEALVVGTSAKSSYMETGACAIESPKKSWTKIACTMISETYVGVMLRVKNEGVNEERTIEIKDFQLELGTTATAYSPYREQLLTLPTPNGLPGVPVTSGGNYTDPQGQQWICDEVDLGREVYVQRVDKGAFDATKALTEQSVILATPIETPLTTAEIATYKSLRTYKGTTIVEAEDKAGISVKYNMPMPKLSKNGALRRWFKRHPII